MKQTIIIFSAFLFIFFSCSKDEIEPSCAPSNNEEEVVEWEMPTSPGSYWVYEWFTIDSSGVEAPMSGGEIDSIKILGDSLLNGYNYTVYENQFLSTSSINLLRNDGEKIIDSEGNIIYKHSEFDETYDAGFYEQLEGYSKYSVMRDERNSPISVPAGEFSCINKEFHVFRDDKADINPCGDTEFLNETYYASGIGEIKLKTYWSAQFMSNCSHLEKRLVEYYIAE